MLIDNRTILSVPIFVPINPADPCNVSVADIEIGLPVTVIWILPPGYQFTSADVSGLAGADFFDGRFDGLSRRRFRWTAKSPGSKHPLTYSLNMEWIDEQGVLRACVIPDLKIVNRS